jgi:hypothetical protein
MDWKRTPTHTPTPTPTHTHKQLIAKTINDTLGLWHKVFTAVINYVV